MARSYTINPDLPTRTYTVTQDGESRTFNAYSGVANVTTTNVAAAGAAMKANDLSDLASTSTARTNLGLGTAATTDTGTGASNTILGNDARLTDARTPTAHTHVSADVTDATSSATASRIVKRGTQGQASFASSTDVAVLGNCSSSGDGGFFTSNTGTALSCSSTSGNHLNAGNGKFIVANNGDTTLTGTIAASNLSGTNTGDETGARIATLITAADAKTVIVDADVTDITDSEASHGFKKVTFTSIWTWISTKLAAITSQTIGGTISFSSATRPTSSGTGTPAATSLITLADADSFYQRCIVKRTSSQFNVTSSTTYVDITGLTDFTLDADTTYRMDLFASATFSTAGGYKMQILSSHALFHTASLVLWTGGASNAGGGGVTVAQTSSTTIFINNRSSPGQTAAPLSNILFIRTGVSAPTIRIQFAQSASDGTASSILSGAMCAFTKYI